MNAQQPRGYFTVGVTGHIDHGKTTLTECLSGKNTDTHPEEKRRGITIDLGFAEFTFDDRRFALIDAPGHTRYIGNLLAGVANLDMAMLIVAADQGIQAQTVEHAAILHGMGVRALVVVVTRVDLCDHTRLQEIDEEIILFLAEVGFEDFPICHCSAKTGQGIEQLKLTLGTLADSVRRSERKSALSARLPVDRVLRVEGRGWVAAGTLFQGMISVGDTLHLANQDAPLRVRNIEQHGTPVEQAQPGYRTAVNLVGDIESIARGDELLSVDGSATTREFFADVRLFTDAPDLKLPAKAQLHTATSTCDAELLGNGKEFREGRLRIRTKTPIVAQHGQNILLRQPYPVGTLASGSVVADVQMLQQLRYPTLPKPWNTWRKRYITKNATPPEIALAEGLHFAKDSTEQLLAILKYCNSLAGPHPQLCNFLALTTIDYEECCRAIATQVGIRRIGQRLVIDDFLSWLADQAVAKLRRTTAEGAGGTGQGSAPQTAAWLPQKAIEQFVASASDEKLAAEAVKMAIKDGRLVTAGQFLAPPELASRLTKNQSRALEQFVDSIDCSSPPTVKELAMAADITIKEATQLLKILQSQGRAIPVGSDFFFSTEQLRTLAREVADWLSEKGAATVAEIRDQLGMTRKHVVPLVESLDRHGITLRNGDVRTVAADVAQRIEELN